MSSRSVVFENGRVYIPSNILKSLGLREGTEISWKFDPQTKRVYIEEAKTQTFGEFGRANVQSQNKIRILRALMETGNFNELLKTLGVSSRTLDKHLTECQRQGLVEHLGRNRPYLLTERGRELLKISETKSAEGNEVIIETVADGPFIGAIVVRWPLRIGREFSGKLYTPKNIEDFNRIMTLCLEFWIGKHSQTSPNVQVSSIGKDFNGDGIEDLIICETPKGYPNIRKALKENKMGLPLWDYCLNAAEEKLAQSS